MPQAKALSEVAKLVRQADEVTESLAGLVEIGFVPPEDQLGELLRRAKQIHERFAALRTN